MSSNKQRTYEKALQLYANQKALKKHGLTKEDIEIMANMPYKDLTKIGSGHFGVVYEIHYKGKVYLRKDLGASDSPENISNHREIITFRELSLLPALEPYIPSYIGAYYKNEKFDFKERMGDYRAKSGYLPGTLSIFMEYIHGIDISRMKYQSEEIKSQFNDAISKAYDAFENEGYVYTDINYGNLIIRLDKSGNVIPVFIDMGGFHYCGKRSCLRERYEAIQEIYRLAELNKVINYNIGQHIKQLKFTPQLMNNATQREEKNEELQTLQQQFKNLENTLYPERKKRRENEQKRREEEQKRREEEKISEKRRKEQQELIEKMKEERYKASWRGKAKNFLGPAAPFVNVIPHRQNIPLIGRFFGGKRSRKQRVKQFNQTRKQK